MSCLRLHARRLWLRCSGCSSRAVGVISYLCDAASCCVACCAVVTRWCWDVGFGHVVSACMYEASGSVAHAVLRCGATEALSNKRLCSNCMVSLVHVQCTVVQYGIHCRALLAMMDVRLQEPRKSLIWLSLGSNLVISSRQHDVLCAGFWLPST